MWRVCAAALLLLWMRQHMLAALVGGRLLHAGWRQ
jgi:hypothetical protein